MKTWWTKLLFLAPRSTMVGFAIAFLLIAMSPVAAQVDCKVIQDAESKFGNVDAHVYTTTNAGGHPLTVEMIYAAGNIYFKNQGKWENSGSRKEMDQLKKNHKNSTPICRYVKDEAVSSEMAAVYSSHEETPSGKVDTQVWISKASGLPLRQETAIDVGGSAGKSVSSARYEYGNIKPPM
jgi:hypothetical protein